MWGAPLTVEFQADQLSLYTTSSMPSTTNSASTSTSPPSQTSYPDPGGVSTGAKAGIAVGAVVGVLILLGVAIVGRRRRRRINVNANSHPVMDEAEGGVQGKDGTPPLYEGIPVELGTGEHEAHAELSGDPLYKEMST